MQITDEQRKAAVEEARQREREASSFQDATKLVRGFEELDDTAGRRGVWELTQNACDLTANCEITVDFRSGELSFSHNGKPFDMRSLTYLIKQVSSKSQEVDKEDGEAKPVGRFGTGFITTHSYGRELLVSGSLAVDGLKAFVDMISFPIDRRGENASQLTKKLAEQQRLVQELLETADYKDTANLTTTFRYRPASDAERASIRQAQESLAVNTPYVMALNQALQSVRLIDEQGQETLYRKGVAEEVDGSWRLPISYGTETILLTCLYKPYGPTQVLMPLGPHAEAQILEEGVPRLFLYFPLIGSEHWGCDFIVHSSLFAPRNERDGVHLTLHNDQVRLLATSNRALLREVSEKVFAFLAEHVAHIEHPLRLARVRFTQAGRPEEQEFRQEMQQLWREQLAQLALVEVATNSEQMQLTGRLAPAKSCFLALELLDCEGETLAAIQRIAEYLWPGQLPRMELAKEWARTLAEWQWEQTTWITAEKLAIAIAAQEILFKFDSDDLLRCYEYLKVHDFGELFERFALLPNLVGTLVKRNELQRAQDLHPAFMEVMESVVPKALSALLNERFTSLETLTGFTRRMLAQQVNDEVSCLLAAPSGTLPESVRNGLLLLCSIFSAETPAVTNSLRWQLMPLIHRFYGREYAHLLIPNVVEAEEIRYNELPLRNMTRQFLQDFRTVYLQKSLQQRQQELPLLRDCLELLSKDSDMRKEVLPAAQIFPNQLAELCLANSLVIEKDFGPLGSKQVEYADQLKDWAALITGSDYRRELVHDDFAEALRRLERPEQTGKSLASSLERQLTDKQSLDKINDHPNQRVILDIIQGMSGVWESYFVQINSLKATITLNRVTDEGLKNSLFGIMSLPNNYIEDIGRLAKVKNLSEILARAQQLVDSQHEQAEKLAFKKLLGERIEMIIRKRLQTQLQQLDVTVLDQQNGQDLVVRVAEAIVYQIEVKSRWDKDYTTTLSYRQSTQAVLHPERYALCSVDLVDYYPTDGSSRHDITDINQIMERIRFVTDIGEQIKPLVGELRRVETDEDAVRLADQFRIVVPRRITNAGKLFEKFMDYLEDVLPNPTVELERSTA
jgi:hypothetical protein